MLGRSPVIDILIGHMVGSYIAVAVPALLMILTGHGDRSGLVLVIALAPFVLPFILIAAISRPHEFIGPIGGLVLVLLYMPGFTFVLMRGSRARQRRERWAAGRCIRCGYSLTGNTSGVCPECGRPIIAPRT